MAKETLPTWPDGWKKENKLKLKWIELVWALTQSKESKKAECDAKNENLLNEFQNECRYYYEDGHECSNHIDEYAIKFLRSWDTIKFTSLYDLKCKINGMSFIDNFTYFVENKHIKLEIDADKAHERSDMLKYLFEHLKLYGGVYSIWIKFPCSLFWFQGEYEHSRESIKMLKKFMLKNECKNCYFDIWDDVYHGQMSYDKKNYLKELITWFTKQWKAWKIKNCVIKANWKEYHSSGDYKYDFE